MIRTLRLIALACVLVLLCLDAGRAQVPFTQSDVRPIMKGSSQLVISAHADDAKDFNIRVTAFDRRSNVAWVQIRAGANKISTLKICQQTIIGMTFVSCQYTWPRSAMPATAEYTIAVALENGIKYEVYGKWQRPELVVP